jgi:hypothetical protein
VHRVHSARLSAVEFKIIVAWFSPIHGGEEICNANFFARLNGLNEVVISHEAVACKTESS